MQPQFTFQVWKAFCQALGAMVSLSLGFHPQSNSQTERANQDFEAALRCVTITNPASWSSHLPWIEYAHNTHQLCHRFVPLFEASLWYQLPLFSSQETKLAVPLVQMHLHRCRRVWRNTRAALLCSAEENHRLADRHWTQASKWQPGQEVWLSTKNISFIDSGKLSPWYIGPLNTLSTHLLSD